MVFQHYSCTCAAVPTGGSVQTAVSNHLRKGGKVDVALARGAFRVIQGYVVPALQRHWLLQGGLRLQGLPEAWQASCR